MVRLLPTAPASRVATSKAHHIITADGRYVTFHSKASNLVAGDTNAKFDQFVHDRETGITERLSVASDGTQGNNDALGFHFGHYSIAGTSADGSHAGSVSRATNLDGTDTNNSADIFFRDRGPVIGISRLAASVAGTQIAVSGRATFAPPERND